MKASLIAIAVLIAFGAARAEEKKTFEQDVLDAIDRIAAQHGVSIKDAHQKTRALFTDGQCWPVKGGVTVIRDELYVLARSKNGVIVGGETIYGMDWKSPEIFVFAGKKFVGQLSVPKGSESDVIVALFTPERIRFFDWMRLSGGFYSRTPE